LTFADSSADNIDSDVTNFVFCSFGSTTYLFSIEFGQDDDLSFDAGYICVSLSVSWYGIDEDDFFDSNENGINGLEVNLYKYNGSDFVLYETNHGSQARNTF
jgi:hypothetical protein